MCVCLFVAVCGGGGYLIKFNSIMISLVFCFIVQMWISFYLRVCITRWIDFAPFQTLPSLPLFLACVWVKSVSWNRACEFICMRVCECVKFYLRYLLPPHFVFYAKFLLACSTCLLCTTLFLLLVFTIILRSIICSCETKLNFSSLFFFSSG